MHLASWLLFVSLPVVFITSQSEDNKAADVLLSPYYWLCILFFSGLFYAHTYLLFPLLYQQRKKAVYFLIVASLFLILLWLRPFDELMSYWQYRSARQTFGDSLQRDNRPPPEYGFAYGNLPPQNHGMPPPRMDNLRQPPPQFTNGSPMRRPAGRVDIVSIFMFIVTLAISISSDVSKRLRITAEQAAKAQTDKANAELFALKAQVNPHFLFNTLNNIYSLAVTGDENTAESIMKLSNIMRYVTDDAPEDFVALQKEIDCLSDFIDLQRLRINSKVIIDYTVSGHTGGRSIAPFILLTFVENVFKYGISKQGSHLIIQVKTDQEGITFFCSNPLPETKETDRKGTGIANVKKRLQYLYPNRHILSIGAGNYLYTVQLFIRDKT